MKKKEKKYLIGKLDSIKLSLKSFKKEIDSGFFNEEDEPYDNLAKLLVEHAFDIKKEEGQL